MVWRLLLISWALAAVSIGLYFSPLGPDEPPVVAPEPAPELAPPPEPAPPPAPAPRQHLPGPLLVHLPGSQLARLDERGWASFPDKRFHFGLQPGPDGAMWAATPNAEILRLGDTGMHTVATLPADQGAELCLALAPVAAEDVWLACRPGVHRWRAGEWFRDEAPHSEHDRSAVDDTPVALARDGGGRLWLATRSRLEVRRELGGWVDLAVPADAEIVALAQGPGASMYMLTRRHLLHYRDDLHPPKQIRIPTRDDEYSHEKLAVSGRGNLVVLTREQQDLAYTRSMAGTDDAGTTFDRVAFAFTTDGAVSRHSDAHDVSLGAPSALAIDDRGRVWWASPAGLAVLGDGPVRRWWRGAVPELRPGTDDRTSAPTDIVVIAGGPESLPAVDEATTHRVRGRVVHGGSPRAGVELELCRTPRHRYRRSPCQDQRLHFSAVSDAKGEFTVRDVPPGDYAVTVKLGDSWQDARSAVFIAATDARPTVLAPIDLRRLPR